MKKLFVFDFDGTLVDSIGGICAAVNFALGKLNLRPVTPDDCLRMVGRGARVLCERALPDGSKHLADEMYRIYYDRYLTNCLDDTRVYRGVPAMLAALDDAGGRLAVLSNKPDTPTNIMANALLPNAGFALVLGLSDDFPRKPDPKMLLYILRVLDVDAADAVMIGDSSEDILTAKAAGVASVGVSWGFRTRPVLEDAGAGIVADTVPQLTDILLSI